MLDVGLNAAARPFAAVAGPTSPVVDFVRDNFENIIYAVVGLIASLVFASLFTRLGRRR